MRDVARDLAEVADQCLDTAEHRVERIGQPIEFVAISAGRDAGMEMAGDDRNRRLVHPIEPAADRPLEQQAAPDRQGDQHQRRQREEEDRRAQQRGRGRRVRGNRQAQPVAQMGSERADGNSGAGIVVKHGILPAGGKQGIAAFARQATAFGVHQDIVEAAAALVDLVERLEQGRVAALSQKMAQAAHFGLDPRIDLAPDRVMPDDIGDAPQQRRGHDQPDDEEQRDQPGSAHAPSNHPAACSRRGAPSGSRPSRSRC